MKFLADENFPRPVLDALRHAGWEVRSIAEECPGTSHEDVAALCAFQKRILLTFNREFGELVFRRGLPAGSGVLVFRVAPESPDELAQFARTFAATQPVDVGLFWEVTIDGTQTRTLDPYYMQFFPIDNPT